MDPLSLPPVDALEMRKKERSLGGKDNGSRDDDGEEQGLVEALSLRVSKSMRSG